MTAVRACLLIAALVAVGAACTGDDAAAGAVGGDGVVVAVPASDGQYRVDGEILEFHGAVSTVVNGVLPTGRDPLSDLVASMPSGTRLTRALTPALVSGANVVAVEVVPRLYRPGIEGGTVAPDGTADGVELGPVRFAFRVLAPDGTLVPGTDRPAAAADSAFAAWTAALAARWPRWRATEDSLYAARPELRAAIAAEVAASAEAARVGRGPALDSAWAWARARPVRVETRFVRPGGARPTDGQPAFDEVLREAPVIGGTAADSARLRRFGVELLRLVERRDGAALYDRFATSVRDLARAGGRSVPPPDTLRRGWAESARVRGPFLLDDVEPFTESDVVLTSWADGRVWELSFPGQRALLVHPEVAAGRSGPMKSVFVGEGSRGELRVVR